MQLTPQTARQLLERNIHNRKISETVIAKYTAEIQAGEWRLVPAGIGFDDHGVLVDGKLSHAVSLTNHPIATMPFQMDSLHWFKVSPGLHVMLTGVTPAKTFKTLAASFRRDK